MGSHVMVVNNHISENDILTTILPGFQLLKTITFRHTMKCVEDGGSGVIGQGF